MGGQDELVAVLSNSGRSLSVYETAKLTAATAKALYSAELKEGLVAAVYPGGCWAGGDMKGAGAGHCAAGCMGLLRRPGLSCICTLPSPAGPPARIPSPPTAPPPAAAEGGDIGDSEDSDAGEDDEAIAARAEWAEAERRRLEPPHLVLLRTQSNQCVGRAGPGRGRHSGRCCSRRSRAGAACQLAQPLPLALPSPTHPLRLVLAEVSPSAVTYSNKSRVLPVRASLALRSGEAVVQVAWQALVPADGSFHSGCEGAGSAVAAAAAVLTSQRVLILDEGLRVLASAGLPADMGLPASCLWLGPALLVSTSTGQVMQVCWDGKLVHVCSLLNSAAPALLGALADRLLVATRPTPTGAYACCLLCRLIVPAVDAA